MTKYYFLTLDYANTSCGPPTKAMYQDVLHFQYDKFKLSPSNLAYPLECYEHKHKSKEYPKWLHYHTIVKTFKYIPYLKTKCPNWSIKYIRINTLEDMAAYAGYIQKDKLDKIDIEDLIEDPDN